MVIERKWLIDLIHLQGLRVVSFQARRASFERSDSMPHVFTDKIKLEPYHV